MKVKNFIEFLLESKGISDVCMSYKNTIWKDFIVKLKDIIDKKQDYGVLIYNFNNQEFKINNLIISIKPIKYKENICNGKYQGSNTIIKNSIFYNGIIEFNILYNDLNKDFLNYIESVLLHELLHCYQRYKTNGKKIPSYWQYGNILSTLRKELDNYNNDDLDKIINLLYYSLEHEMSAQLHQYYDFMLKGKKYERIFDIKKSLEEYKIPNKIDNNFMIGLITIVYHFNKSLKLNTPNNNYTKNIDNSLWSYKLSEDNIDSFLVNLKNYFNNCSNFLDKKINQINRKIKNYEHIDYSMTISDIEIFYNIIN